MDPRTRMLLEAPVSRTIVRLALPNVVVMVVQTSIGLIETYFVAKLGLDALAAMALVFPLFMLLQWCQPARWAAAFSRRLRARSAPTMRTRQRLVWHALAITVVLGAAVTIAALLWGPEALCADGRARLLARTGGNLFGHRLRRRRSALAVQFHGGDDPRYRQHDLACGFGHDRRRGISRFLFRRC